MNKVRRTVYKCAPGVGCGLSIKPHEERRTITVDRGRTLRRMHRKCYVRVLIPAHVADGLSERELSGIEEVVWAFGPDTVEGMLRMTEHDWGDELVLDAQPWDFAAGALVGEYLGDSDISVFIPEEGESQMRKQHLVAIDGNREDTAFAWGGFQLDQTLPEHKGHFIRISDTGEKKELPGGRTMKRFSVKCKTCATPQVG